MEALSTIESFVRSAESGSFSAAARRMGLTPAAVSKNVAKLEANLGVRLFQRSTRSLALTEAGERLLSDVGSGLATLQAAMSNLASSGGLPAGTLKVSLAPAFGRDYVLPLLTDFLEKFPAVVPDWHFENRQVDLIGEGFDAAIGGGIELAPGVVARELSRLHLIPVAAPAYLTRHPPIRSPQALASLDGVVWRSPQTGRVRPWLLQKRDGQQATVELKPRVTMNDPEALCRGVLMGLGVGLVGMPHALPHLHSGALVRLLPRWYSDVGAVSLYYAGTKLLPAKTRAFVDFMVGAFRMQDLAGTLRADR
ncbi:MAG: LysR family transcriptional regulator [Rhodocyclaceae bacterium]|jgi:DNA-binding transcriptional LysR family regulator|nr:LysR family transcriptional regulator [Rhodocyclaceae bacterium]MCA3019269.1 LysR family transcriptional regulator [Rhodocyclaceae bacterium]MCA3022116.1 LysR family transcriptional regulator [Rhodocyclaceae bacterium]MCA3024265.1 LysR family transcriptional regulator [Rhodocyclaceae bacterium]MCA3027373.1 LysR family transcriptional regulator [Rhodocyclaceae bacterium]